jgi:hypothetical protein
MRLYTTEAGYIAVYGWGGSQYLGGHGIAVWYGWST